MNNLVISPYYFLALFLFSICCASECSPTLYMFSKRSRADLTWCKRGIMSGVVGWEQGCNIISFRFALFKFGGLFVPFFVMWSPCVQTLLIDLPKQQKKYSGLMPVPEALFYYLFFNSLPPLRHSHEGVGGVATEYQKACSGGSKKCGTAAKRSSCSWFTFRKRPSAFSRLRLVNLCTFSTQNERLILGELWV